MPSKPIAFLKKDFLNESSYKLAFLFNIFGVFTSILGYFFIDLMFGKKITPYLETFGVNYFAYVLLGMAFFSYAGSGLGSFSSRIRMEQTQGTLENILLTPTSISTILFSIGLWNLVVATLDMAVYIALGIFIFKINFTNLNIISTVVILILTITSFSGLGILSASFILLFKRGNPLEWLISTLEGLLGGVYFPITVLPGWLQVLANFLPITYAIRAIQLAVYRGYSVFQLSREIIFLSLFSIILIPLSFMFFNYALRRVKKDGTLGQY